MSALLLSLLLAATPACKPPSPLPPRPTVVGWGDSILAGACASTAPMTVLRTLFGAGWHSYNGGLAGDTAEQIATRYTAGYATSCLGEECEHVWFEGGVNSIKRSVTPAQAVAQMVAMVDDALARGRYVVWSDVLPYRGCGFCGAGVVNAYSLATQFNSLMASECASRAGYARLRCVFNFSAFEDPARAGQGYLLPAYDCDGIHLTQAGTDALVASVHLAFRQLRGLP